MTATTNRSRPIPVQNGNDVETAADVINLLGTMNDSALARQTGLSRSSIRHMRLSRGIEIVSGKAFLPDEVILALGKVRDCELAAVAGRTESTIRSARIRRGIPPYLPKPPSTQTELQHAANSTKSSSPKTHTKKRNLRQKRSRASTVATISKLKALDETSLPSAELLDALRLKPDREVSKHFGIAAKKLKLIRATHGIPTYWESRFTDDVKELMATSTNAKVHSDTGIPLPEIAAARIKFGINKPVQKVNLIAPVRKTRAVCTEEIKILLSECSTTEVSRRTGISTHQLFRIRNEYSIKKTKLRYQPSPELLNELGKIQDIELAVKYNVSAKWIRKVRIVYAIPRFNPNLGLPKTIIPWLGKTSDRMIAKVFGCGTFLCRKLRAEHGISEFLVRGQYKIPPELLCLMQEDSKRLKALAAGIEQPEAQNRIWASDLATDDTRRRA